MSCVAGTYRGALTGEITWSGSRTRVTATLTLALTGSGSSLEIQSGTLVGKDAEGHEIRARVSGALNCTGNKLENGRLSDGEYARREGLVAVIRFSGTLAATYTASPAALQGTWTLESALGTRSGSGAFSSALQ
jgi:hypothetical protein